MRYSVYEWATLYVEVKCKPSLLSGKYFPNIYQGPGVTHRPHSMAPLPLGAATISQLGHCGGLGKGLFASVLVFLLSRRNQRILLR